MIFFSGLTEKYEQNDPLENLPTNQIPTTDQLQHKLTTQESRPNTIDRHFVPIVSDTEAVFSQTQTRIVLSPAEDPLHNPNSSSNPGSADSKLHSENNFMSVDPTTTASVDFFRRQLTFHSVSLAII